MVTASSRSDQDREATLPGSFRHKVLLAARRFKAGWVELAQLLVRVKDENQFEAWGYSTFEAYCARELKIRRQTALKLLRSYYFLSRHEPGETLGETLHKRAPSFEVVEVFADMDQRHPLSAGEYREVRDSIWNPDKRAAEVKRELSQRFPEWTPAQRERKSDPGRLAQTARRLAEDLAKERDLPRGLAQRASALAAEIEAWVADLTS